MEEIGSDLRGTRAFSYIHNSWNTNQRGGCIYMMRAEMHYVTFLAVNHFHIRNRDFDGFSNFKKETGGKSARPIYNNSSKPLHDIDMSLELLYNTTSAR